jgi:hypothetical protein
MNTSLSISNSKIKEFYDCNPTINFEDINLLMIELLEKNIVDEMFTNEIIKNLLSNNMTMSEGEKNMEIILSSICPTDKIIKNTNMLIHCDFILKRQNKPRIIIENKESFTNIDTEVTDFFIESLKEQNCCGIFISQHSGIINKQNFKIEIYNGNILVYISNCKYNSEKIKNSIELIYTLHEKLQLFNNEINPIISSSLLSEINNEYQMFLTYKESVIKFIKENNNTIIKQIENFKFDVLDKYLSTKFVDKQKNCTLHKCNLCNVYSSKTLKGIAAHKKGCIKKIQHKKE